MLSNPLLPCITKIVGSAKQVRMRGSGERSTTLPQCDSPTS